MVINGVLYKDEEDWPLFEEEESKSKGETSTKATETVTQTKTDGLTGAFTATETPGDDEDGAMSGRSVWKGGVVMGLLTAMVVMW